MIRAWGEEDMAAAGWYVRAFEDDSYAIPYSGGGGLSSGADGVGDRPLRVVEAESEKKCGEILLWCNCLWFAQIVYSSKYKLLFIGVNIFYKNCLISTMSIDMTIFLKFDCSCLYFKIT